MRILLVGTNFCRDPYPVYPLGMAVVAGALAGAGHEVRQFDVLAAGEEWRGAARELSDVFLPELVGFSIRNVDDIDSTSSAGSLIGRSLEVVRQFRAFSGAPFVLGGAGYSLYPEKIRELAAAEYGIAGEGEDAFVDLVAKITAGIPPEPGVYRSACREQSPPLYDGALLEYYGRETHIIPLQTKRGCPFRCGYCTYPALEGRRIRPRPVDGVIADLQQISERAPDALVYFVDAVFNDPAGNFRVLLDAMIARGVTPPWTGFVTPSRLHPEDVGQMVRAGMVACDLGVDACSDPTLAGLDKDFDFSAVSDAVRLLRKSGVGVTASVMFGGPGETPETLEAGIANLNALAEQGVLTMVFAGIRLLAGSPLFERLRSEGALPPERDGFGACYYFSPGIGREALDARLREAFGASSMVIYPPGRRNEELRMLHKFGYIRLRRANK